MSAAFTLLELPALSRSTVVRDELRRLDQERLTAGWAAAVLLRVDPSGKVATRDDVLVREHPSGDGPAKDAVLLGEDDGVEVWAVATPELELLDGEVALDLRSGGALLDATDAGLLTTAVALLTWHAAARFCPVDGGRTTSAKAGWVRVCRTCEREQYPRTDAAVICLVHDGTPDAPAGAHVLLGRQATWPQGRFSVLAGFVEAGESLEACVEREISEEVGVAVTGVHYLGSQPWPFPRSMMIGFEATADPDVPIVPRDGEIAEAHWYSREAVREALDRGEWTGGTGDPGDQVPLLLPGSISIARKMIEAWAQAGAPTDG